jgi:Protein of unknown function (DUF2934)
MATRRSLDTPTSTTPTSGSQSVSPGKPLATGKIAAGAAGTAAARITPEVRRAMIAERAYLRAEKRGFTPGRETEDWLAAEVEIDSLLRASRGGSSQ